MVLVEFSGENLKSEGLEFAGAQEMSFYIETENVETENIEICSKLFKEILYKIHGIIKSV